MYETVNTTMVEANDRSPTTPPPVNPCLTAKKEVIERDAKKLNNKNIGIALAALGEQS